MDIIKIGTFIKTQRTELNLTQKDLAEKIGCTDKAISRWETGKGLPDVSYMKKLCEILEISVDELLSGEHIPEEKHISAKEKNIIDLLLQRELEIKKRLFLKKLCAAMIFFAIVLCCFVGTKSVSMIYSSISGDGQSFYTSFYTQKAEKVANLIEKELYEKAAEYVGFEGQNKQSGKVNFTKNMDLLGDQIKIESFVVSEIVLEDHFPLGTYILNVTDKKSDAQYIFNGQLTIQDKGIAFGEVYILYGNTDYRRTEVAEIINDALCTWYAG